MQTPPPFNPGSPYTPPIKKKSPIGLIVALIVGLLAICCILPLGGVAAFWKKVGGGVMDTAGCAVGEEIARQALMDYEAQNGKFPPAATWQDDLQPFLAKRLESKHVKDQMGPFKIWGAGEEWVCSQEPPKSGIAYNEDIAGKKRSEVPGSTIALFEVPSVGKNQHMAFGKRSGVEPKIFGEPRPWLDMPVEGDHKRRGGVHIETNVDTSDSEDPANSEDTAKPGVKKAAKSAPESEN